MSDAAPKAAKSEKRQRAARLFLRLTAEEKAAILARADKAGMTPPAYLRAAALGTAGPRAQRRIPADAGLLRQVLGHLGRVGNNLNQIARHLNRGREDDQYEALDAALHELAGIRDMIYVALGKEPDHAGPAAPAASAPEVPSISADFAAAARRQEKPAPQEAEPPKAASRFTRPPRP